MLALFSIYLNHLLSSIKVHNAPESSKQVAERRLAVREDELARQREEEEIRLEKEVKRSLKGELKQFFLSAPN